MPCFVTELAEHFRRAGGVTAYDQFCSHTRSALTSFVAGIPPIAGRATWRESGLQLLSPRLSSFAPLPGLSRCVVRLLQSQKWAVVLATGQAVVTRRC